MTLDCNINLETFEITDCIGDAVIALGNNDATIQDILIDHCSAINNSVSSVSVIDMGTGYWGQNQTDSLEVSAPEIILRRWRRPRLIGSVGGALAGGSQVLIPNNGVAASVPFKGPQFFMNPDSDYLTNDTTNHILSAKQAGTYTVDLRVALQPENEGFNPADTYAYQLFLYATHVGTGAVVASTDTRTFMESFGATTNLLLRTRLENIALTTGSTFEAYVRGQGPGTESNRLKIWEVGASIYVEE